MSDTSLFDRYTTVLSKTKNTSDIKIRFVNSKNKPILKQIPIYNDDTCKDVLLKLSSLHSTTIGDHIFAWYKEGTTVIPLGFSYPSLELDYLYKDKGSLDPRFITDDRNRILVISDKKPLHTLISEFSIKTLFYTTIHEYLQYLNLTTNRSITDEVCLEKTKFSCRDLYNGKLVKYWPMLTSDQIFNLSTTDLDPLIFQQLIKQD